MLVTHTMGLVYDQCLFAEAGSCLQKTTGMCPVIGRRSHWLGPLLLVPATQDTEAVRCSLHIHSPLVRLHQWALLHQILMEQPGLACRCLCLFKHPGEVRVCYSYLCSCVWVLAPCGGS